MNKLNSIALVIAFLTSGFVSKAQELDSTFGENGFVPYGGPISNSENNLFVATKMDFQSDGKIVVGTKAADDWFTYIYRYLENGEADFSYGTNGVSKIFTGSDSECHDLKIQDDDKTVIVSETGYCINGVCGAPQFLMMRGLPNGDIDSTFGNNGKILSNHIFTGNGTFGKAFALEILDDGRFIISGRGEDSNPFVARLNENGFPDLTYGNDGFFYDTTGAVTDMALDEDNNAYVLMSRYSQSNEKHVNYLIKTDSSGNLVTGFGNNGRLSFTNSADTTSMPTSIDYAEGKLIVSSKSFNPNILMQTSSFFKKYNSYLHYFDTDGNYTNPNLEGGVKITVPEDTTVLINETYAYDENNFLIGGLVHHLENGNFQNRAFVGLVDSNAVFHDLLGDNGYMMFDLGVTSQTGWNGKLAEILDLDFDENNNSLYMAGFKNPIGGNTMRSVLLGKINDIEFQAPSNLEVKEYENYKIYPNPNNGSFYVETNTVSNNHYVIYNLSGVMIDKGELNQSKSHISLPKESATGMYILKLVSDNNNSFHKIIKE